MTTNCGIFYPNIANRASLSGGSWTSELPLENLLTRTIAEVARTTDAAESSTRFIVELDKVRPISVLGIVNHNLSLDAQYRFRMFDDVDLTLLAYDSGLIDTYPAVYDEDTDPGGWDGGNLWDLQLTEEELESFTPTLVHVLTTTTAAKYLLVEFFDSGNPDLYVSVGRLFMADGWTPTNNMSYGASLGYTPRDEIDEADSGAEYFNARTAPRYAQFELGFMRESEAMAKAFDIQRIVGTTGEVLFVWNQEDTVHFMRRSFLARLRELSPIETNFFDNFRTTHTVKELL